MSKKCIVVHAEARDSYQLALALVEKGYLEQLVTDFYYNDIYASLFPADASKRYCVGLPSSKVSICVRAFLLSVRMRIQGSFIFNKEKDLALSQMAFYEATKKHAHMFCYSYYAHFAFTQAIRNRSNMRRLLFQLHPHPLSVKKILQQELTQVPQARKSIMHENELKYSSDDLQNLGDESHLAEGIVVASSYTRNTLVENGVDANKIKVVPYGINPQKFVTRTFAPDNKMLRVIFVGSMVQRKGLSYLFEALKLMGPGEIELILCGRGFIDDDLLNFYQGLNFVVKKDLSQGALLAELHQSDVFVLPSLCEGFGHVILEAMASGLPVIATTNTCAPDIVEDGKEGFVIPISNTDALVEKFRWCIENKDMLFDMGQAAALKSTYFTWTRFRKGIRDFYESALESS